MAVKINDLDLASAINPAMQLETDVGGSTANKITVAQISNHISNNALGTVSVFAPADKYSPLKMEPLDGWANGNDDYGPAATHDASGGSAPSHTTAKRKSIAIVTVAGTLGGKSVAKGDILMALQDNPTTAAHWAIIADSTTEFDAAVNAAQGAPILLNGTYILNSTTLNAPINLVGEYTILNRCGYPAIYTGGNNTRAASQGMYRAASAGAGSSTGVDIDDELGSSLQHVSFFRLNTVAEVSNFKIGQRVEVFTNATHIADAASSSKGYISNAFVVTSVDSDNGIVYADRVLKYHNKIANASNIFLIPLHEDRAVRIRKGALFMGCPTIIGEQVGWWLTIDGATPISATISGSGSTRTLTFGSNLNWVALQGLRIGSVSGVPEASCRISSVNAGANQVTITVATVNDKGQAWTAPTSGTVYVVPAFWTSEFDSTTHGGAIVLQQAHGSEIECDVARLWGAGVRARFSHYCQIKVSAKKTINIGTGISGKSWRLVYLCEVYSSCRNDVVVESTGWGGGGRHPYTTGYRDTSSTWTQTLWQSSSGATCENRVRIKSRGDSGPAADTHALTNGDDIESDVEYTASFNTAHSYRGIGAQDRSDNSRYKHRQRGGQVGLRIANGSKYAREANSINEVDIDISDLPMRADAHGLTGGSIGNMVRGFWMQSQAAYTNKTLTIGRAKFKNAGCGIHLENSCRARFERVDHASVGYAIAALDTASELYMAECNADYSLGSGNETTSVSSVVLGTGSKSFTITSSLPNFVEGMDVLVQDAANPRTNYGWGRIVSYSGSTLTVNLEGIRGSGTISSWVITSAALNPRLGIAMSGTAQVTIGVLRWKVGAGANPTEFFHSRDNTSGKVVNVGMIIVDDPFLKGLPANFTSGRSADFTMKIGMIIYNGRVVSGVGMGSIVGDFDGSGSVLTVGSKARVTVPFSGVIQRFYITSDQTGSIVVDVNRAGSSIVGAGNKPTLSSASSANAEPASWTSTTVTKGDIIEFEIDSASTVTQANVVLEIQKT